VISDLRILVKLDQIYESQQESLALQRRLLEEIAPNVVNIDDVLPQPWGTDEELTDACNKLIDDPEFRKKIVRL